METGQNAKHAGEYFSSSFTPAAIAYIKSFTSELTQRSYSGRLRKPFQKNSLDCKKRRRRILEDPSHALPSKSFCAALARGKWGLGGGASVCTVEEKTVKAAGC